MNVIDVIVPGLLLGSSLAAGGVGAPLGAQCMDVEGAVEAPDVPPVPLMTNPIPRCPSLLLDAGIGDTAVVRLVVNRVGTVDPSSYCVERPPEYSWSNPVEVWKCGSGVSRQRAATDPWFQRSTG
jgi:hypothetical protein